MGNALISNPPYNMKWKPPTLAEYDPRFAVAGTPPASNANYAFILSGIYVSDKSCFVLPASVLSPKGVEAKILACLVESNLLEAVIGLPDKMFESTSIATVILVFNKKKETEKITFVDMRQTYAEEERVQNGQFGGASHENRTYKKTIKVLTKGHIDRVLQAIKEKNSESEFCKTVSLQTVREHEYNLRISNYIDLEIREEQHRSFKDIANDYNRIIQKKNAIQLTVNETIAKRLGLYEAFQSKDVDVSKPFDLVGEKAEEEDFIRFTKSAEFKITCRTNTGYIPELIRLLIMMWKNNIMELNNEENRILAEMRDALLPKLMSGEIKIE